MIYASSFSGVLPKVVLHLKLASAWSGDIHVENFVVDTALMEFYVAKKVVNTAN